MKLESAISLAKAYAESYELAWEGSLRVIHTHSWWQILDGHHVFEMSSAKGRIIAHTTGNFLYRLEYYPNDKQDDLLPLWIAYPGLNSFTSAWRQSNGEQYKFKWNEWFAALSSEEQLRYRLKYPEPSDPDLMWTGFYEGYQPN